MAANGKSFNPAAMCCATRQWPLGATLIVTDSHNGSSVVVTVTDRPARRFKNRVDLSPAAFEKLNGLDLGLADVSVKLVN